MQTNKTFSVSEALKFGWETFKVRPFFWIVAGILASDGFGGGASESDRNNSSDEFFKNIDPTLLILIIVAIIIIGLIFIGLRMGAMKAAIGALENKKPKWGILVSEFDLSRIWGFIVVSFRYGITVLFGLLLLVIPGIYFAVKYQFAPYFYIERNVSSKEAMRLSAEATKGMIWKLIGFHLVSGILIFLGALTLLVGLFVAIPVVVLAEAYVYRKLSATQTMPTAPIAPEPVAPAMPVGQAITSEPMQPAAPSAEAIAA